MTENQKSVWITALRSGDYKQCIGNLHIDGGHCCLGVAENVLCIEKGEPFGELVGKKFLPIEIQMRLSRMNDAGLPFEVIAGFIEENIEPTE